MITLLTGKHSLKVVDVTEKESKVRQGRLIVTIETETTDTNVPVKVWIHIGEGMNPYFIKKIVNRFSTWHADRLGRSITQTDFKFLIGKTGIFDIETAEYQDRKLNRVKI